jgi:glycosyltransferase involved in cell wall biosynthesis/ubiquinone/menaquinone biosynthesis C-methylase UbiE
MIYPDLFNPDLLDRIPLDARVVLDVGCGTGALGAEYKRRNPAARVLGIERDPAAAEIAEQRLDAVARADLDLDALPFGETLPAGSVDCLLYGDVLEHLTDPWTLLRAHVPLLSERGVVVICMPNAEHWSFAERLLRGTFAYEPLGLFDQSHLRWFTTETMRRTLRAVGLTPLDAIPRIFDKQAAEAFCDAAEPGLRRLGIDVAHYRERCAPLQHVWRARRRPTRPLPLVSTMLNPVGGVSHLRVVEPMAALAAEPSLATRVIDNAEAFTADPDNPGIFIFHRPLLAGGSGIARVREIAERGWLVLCEFDDHPDYIPVLQRPDVQNFRAVHAVQTSTEPLAEVLRRDNPEIKVFPNGVARMPDVANFRDPGRITMLFAGINREKEWQPYLDALNSVVRKVGERLQVVVVNDRPLFELLATPHKRFVPLCGYDTYQALLGASEISFAPLIDTPFNRCKSDLKFIEAAAHRVTVLASRVVYEGSVRDGETGVLFSTGEELEQRLLRLAANPEIARAIGDAARAYVMRERMLAYQIAERVAWYHALWARRAELHAGLLQRVPEFVG